MSAFVVVFGFWLVLDEGMIYDLCVDGRYSIGGLLRFLMELVSLVCVVEL